MLFNSIEFCFFFPIVSILYFLCTHRLKKNIVSQILLLTASLFFYACWKPAYLLLILTSVVITYTSGILIERHEGKKKMILAFSLVSNLAILFFFKYYNFFAESLLSASTFFGHELNLPNFNILLPVGISFYTFQAIGYSIDVYYRKVDAERNFITYALFVTFFPQLVAGPIERTKNLLDQFKLDYKIDYERITDGLKLMAWGLVKKIVIADFLAVYVNSIYNNLNIATGLSLAFATFLFSFQILCDFSGYSDIAIGVSKILGFNLMRNFDHPYFSRSIPEFWRRWHISLSTWFKDYLYIPLGGNRCSTPRRYFNLFATFLVSGIWHGAAWHYIAWGIIHGVYQIAGLSLMKLRIAIGLKTGVLMEDPSSKNHVDAKKGWKILQMLATFLLVSFAWMFFRANSMEDSLVILNLFRHIPSEMGSIFKAIFDGSVVTALDKAFLLSEHISGYGFKLAAKAVTYIAILVGVDFITRRESGLEIIRRQKWYIRWILYYAAVIFIVFMNSGAKSEFIYFQF